MTFTPIIIDRGEEEEVVVVVGDMIYNISHQQRRDMSQIRLCKHSFGLVLSVFLLLLLFVD